MYVERDEFEHAQRAAEILAAHGAIISAALTAFSEQMTAAGQAQAAWETLRDDPEAARAHDISGALVTARGYQGLAQIWRGNAEAARAAQQALRARTGGPDDPRDPAR